MTKLSGPILGLCHVTCEIGSCALALKKVGSDTVKAIYVEEKQKKIALLMLLTRDKAVSYHRSPEVAYILFGTV